MRKKQGQHFADIFEVLEKDPDGKRFDKGTDYGCKLRIRQCLSYVRCTVGRSVENPRSQRHVRDGPITRYKF